MPISFVPLLATVENETLRRETFSFEIYDVEYCGTARFRRDGFETRAGNQGSLELLVRKRRIVSRRTFTSGFVNAANEVHDNDSTRHAVGETIYLSNWITRSVTCARGWRDRNTNPHKLFRVFACFRSNTWYALRIVNYCEITCN